MSTARQRYARLMGDFWRHPRTASLSPSAAGVLVRAWSYCADQMTDGVVPHALVPAFFGGAVVDDAIVSELVSAGLWRKTKVGYQMRDWAQRNITREGWEAKKEGARQRKAKQRGKHEPERDDAPDKGPGHVDVTRDMQRDESVIHTSVTRVPLDEGRRTKDEERSNDRRRGSPSDATTTGLRAVHEAEAAAESAELVHSSTLAAMAESAYARAIHATKSGVYEPAPKWREAFLAAARLATRIAERDAREARAVLAEWASRYVAERTSRRPDWWLERVTTWAAEGASSAPSLSPEAAELARLDAAIDRAEQRGDFEELERLRAELRSMSERHRARGAA